ncbi:unnamed protein product [Heterobilharzia americana]|nr:unnamed protein product [Heterobilharzia americana]
MICDVMPTITEDVGSQGDRDSLTSGDGTNVEDMLLSMLDERDRLMEGLRESQEQVNATRMRLSEVERERDKLHAQLSVKMPQDVVELSKRLTEVEEQLVERCDEIADLKAERNNMKILLEHLENLVARHERSLRMTVVKRHTSTAMSTSTNSLVPSGSITDNEPVCSEMDILNPSSNYALNTATGSISPSMTGLGSEVEVLKALKSLFEHHKVLDEKVHNRLRVSQNKVTELENELSEIKRSTLSTVVATTPIDNDLMESDETNSKVNQDQLKRFYWSVKNINCMNLLHPLFHFDLETTKLPQGTMVGSKSSEPLTSSPVSSVSLSNLFSGSASAAAIEAANRIKELQQNLEQRASELLAARRQVIELTSRSRESANSLSLARSELNRANDQIERLSRELREAEQRRSDQESLATSLEQRYLIAQRELNAAQDMTDKLRAELAFKSTQLKQQEEKVRMLQIKLDAVEDDLLQSRSISNHLLNTSSRSKYINEDDDGIEESEEHFCSDESNPELMNKQASDGEKRKPNESSLRLINRSRCISQQDWNSYEDRIKELTDEIEEVRQELARAKEREIINEEHITRLSGTVDKLLQESNERLQNHLQERMSALEQKQYLTNQIEQTRRALDSAIREREANITESVLCRQQLSELAAAFRHSQAQLAAAHTSASAAQAAIMAVVRASAEKASMERLQQQNADISIQSSGIREQYSTEQSNPVDLISRLITNTWIPSQLNNTEQSLEINPQVDMNTSTFVNTAINTANGNNNNLDEFHQPNDLQEMLLQQNLANYNAASSQINSDGNNQLSINEIINLINMKQQVPSTTLRYNTQGGESDSTANPQSLAYMLKNQLDAINNEIQLIQNEKVTTEMLAEELQGRFGTLDINVDNASRQIKTRSQTMDDYVVNEDNVQQDAIRSGGSFVDGVSSTHKQATPAIHYSLNDQTTNSGRHVSSEPIAITSLSGFNTKPTTSISTTNSQVNLEIYHSQSSGYPPKFSTTYSLSTHPSYYCYDTRLRAPMMNSLPVNIRSTNQNSMGLIIPNVRYSGSNNVVFSTGSAHLPALSNPPVDHNRDLDAIRRRTQTDLPTNIHHNQMTRDDLENTDNSDSCQKENERKRSIFGTLGRMFKSRTL